MVDVISILLGIVAGLVGSLFYWTIFTNIVEQDTIKKRIEAFNLNAQQKEKMILDNTEAKEIQILKTADEKAKMISDFKLELESESFRHKMIEGVIQELADSDLLENEETVRKLAERLKVYIEGSGAGIN